MEIGTLFMVALAGNVVLAAVAASIARSKGQSYAAFLALGLFFSPIAILAAAFFIQPRREAFA